VSCEKEIPIVESESYLELTFGMARRPGVRVTELEREAMRGVARVLHPRLALNWHGAGDGSGDRLHPGVYPGVEIDERHPDAPRPPANDHQAELYFCSPRCLRDWFNAAVDALEAMLERGEVEGQLVNPPLRRGRSGVENNGMPNDE
jgi:hypothetical protein